ncbi:MAG: hypothetical protein GX039_00230 [Clostridia bacterium]|nr:hypothetical protein [Clostridia bacterium]
MIVVTINKWRQKFVWLLAVILVATVLVGQFIVGTDADRDVTTDTIFLPQQEEAPAAALPQDNGGLESLLTKLKNYYQGR